MNKPPEKGMNSFLELSARLNVEGNHLYPQVEAILSRWGSEGGKLRGNTQGKLLFFLSLQVASWQPENTTRNKTHFCFVLKNKKIGNNTMAGYYKQGSSSWHEKDPMMKLHLNYNTSSPVIPWTQSPPVALLFFFLPSPFCTTRFIELWSANKWNFNLSWTSVTKAVGTGRN